MAKHASRSKSEKLMNAVKDMIIANFSAVIKKPQWKEFVKNHPDFLVDIHEKLAHRYQTLTQRNFMQHFMASWKQLRSFQTHIIIFFSTTLSVVWLFWTKSMIPFKVIHYPLLSQTHLSCFECVLPLSYPLSHLGQLTSEPNAKLSD